MKKTLLLISYNFHPEPTGIGKYNGEMISWFVSQGYDCTVVTSYPYYPHWKVQEPYFKRRFLYTVEKSTDTNSGGSLKIYWCPQYVPSKPSGLKRVILDLTFFMSATLPLLRLLTSKKFDYVLTTAPSFQIGLLGVLFRKLQGSKFLYHIQDLQIEAAQDLNLIKSKNIINVLFKIEKYILDRCDVISTISAGMVNKVRSKTKKDVVLFPNWTDTDSFHPIENKADLKKSYSYKPSDKIVLYSGAIGEKQGLEAILNIADQLRKETDLKFIICGSGPYKKELQNLADQLQLQNVNFMPLQDYSKFNDFLNLADIHLVIQKASASDLVMPSKLTTILAVGGLAIITANPGSGLHTLVQEHNIGVLAEAENTDDLKAAILKVIKEGSDHIRKNARKYAEHYLSIDKVLLSYEKNIQKAKSSYSMNVTAGSHRSISPNSVSKVSTWSSGTAGSKP